MRPPASETPVIGPNAVTRLAEALVEMEGPARCTEIFGKAGLACYLSDPPQEMVPEEHVAELHKVMHGVLGGCCARAVGWRAGELTGAYLLANRVPKLAQVLLRHTPKAVSVRLMAAAIAGHAWTFTGGGTLGWRCGRTLFITIRGSPVARRLQTGEPACSYYAATFEAIFTAVVGPGVAVHERACEATGAEACLFEVVW